MNLRINDFKRAKRVIVFVVGVTLLLLGGVMLIAPGPGILVITLGLTVLAAEFVWAQRLLSRFRKEGIGLYERLRGTRAAAWLMASWRAHIRPGNSSRQTDRSK